MWDIWVWVCDSTTQRMHEKKILEFSSSSVEGKSKPQTCSFARNCARPLSKLANASQTRPHPAMSPPTSRRNSRSPPPSRHRFFPSEVPQREPPPPPTHPTLLDSSLFLPALSAAQPEYRLTLVIAFFPTLSLRPVPALMNMAKLISRASCQLWPGLTLPSTG